MKLYSAAFTDYILQTVSYHKKDWWGPAYQSFFWYDTDQDVKAHFAMIQDRSLGLRWLGANSSDLHQNSLSVMKCGIPGALLNPMRKQIISHI